LKKVKETLSAKNWYSYAIPKIIGDFILLLLSIWYSLAFGSFYPLSYTSYVWHLICKLGYMADSSFCYIRKMPVKIEMNMLRIWGGCFLKSVESKMLAMVVKIDNKILPFKKMHGVWMVLRNKIMVNRMQVKI